MLMVTQTPTEPPTPQTLPLPGRGQQDGVKQTNLSLLLHGGLPRAISIHYQEARTRHSLWCLFSSAHTYSHTHTVS